MGRRVLGPQRDGAEVGVPRTVGVPQLRTYRSQVRVREGRVGIERDVPIVVFVSQTLLSRGSVFVSYVKYKLIVQVSYLKEPR